MIDIRTNPKIKESAQLVAEQMIQNNLDEKELIIPNTGIKLFLVRDDTEKVKKLNLTPGAFLGISFEFKGIKFLVFRTNKTANL